jgi:hypothetical protein
MSRYDFCITTLMSCPHSDMNVAVRFLYHGIYAVPTRPRYNTRTTSCPHCDINVALQHPYHDIDVVRPDQALNIDVRLCPPLQVIDK